MKSGRRILSEDPAQGIEKAQEASMVHGGEGSISARVLAIAVPCGAGMGFLALVVSVFPSWYLRALDASSEGRTVVPFLTGATADVLLACVFGGLVGGIVFGVLLKKFKKGIWPLGCPLVTVLLSSAGVFIYALLVWYINFTYPFFPATFLSLVEEFLFPLVFTIPPLVCLTPVGLLAGVLLQAATKNWYRQ